MHKSPLISFTTFIRGSFFWAVFLGITTMAVAHHGNPQAPTTPPWYESPVVGTFSR
jgi:hypothetical protein